MKKSLKVAVALGMAVCATNVGATVVVAPNYETTEGPVQQYSPFSSSVFTNLQMQFGYAASLLSGLPSGSVITGIGFRLDGSTGAPASAISFAQFDVRIGTPAKAIGSFSTTFADNLGADTVLARSGSLTIPVGSFVNSASNPNPFYVLSFSTPYVYGGGDLILSLDVASPTGPGFVPIDAAQIADGFTDSVGKVDDVDAFAHTYFIPVTQFVTQSPVPEPASWVLMIAGFGLVGAGLRRRGTETLAAA